MIAIKGGKVLTITNGVIDDGVVLIEKGKIKAIGKDVKIPADAKVINAKQEGGHAGSGRGPLSHRYMGGDRGVVWQRWQRDD